jgi:hypothetical protein
MSARKRLQKTWSLAAAAWAAREARIAGVRYMKTPLEHDCHAALLAHGYGARKGRTGNTGESRALMAATMGYSSPFDSWDQASTAMLADESRHLAAADLYILTPQMLDVVIAAAQSLILADLALLREDDLPSLAAPWSCPARWSPGTHPAAWPVRLPSPGGRRPCCRCRAGWGSAWPGCPLCGCPRTSPLPGPLPPSCKRPAPSTSPCRPCCSRVSGHCRCTPRP